MHCCCYWITFISQKSNWLGFFYLNLYTNLVFRTSPKGFNSNVIDAELELWVIRVYSNLVSANSIRFESVLFITNICLIYCHVKIRLGFSVKWPCFNLDHA